MWHRGSSSLLQVQGHSLTGACSSLPPIWERRLTGPFSSLPEGSRAAASLEIFPELLQHAGNALAPPRPLIEAHGGEPHQLGDVPGSALQQQRQQVSASQPATDTQK